MTNREQPSADLQALYLQGMGIQAWALREESNAEPEPAPECVPEPVSEPLPVVSETPASETLASERQVSERQVSETRVSDVPVMDEEPPLPTDDFMPSLDMTEVEAPLVATPAIDVSTLDWPELQTTVSACTACELHKTRTQTVFGVGAHDAQWMIIGEAPGADEDRQGEPFVGPAGQLLNNMLKAVGLQREQVFIANILKCRPPENRNPQPEEVAQCEAFLQRQVALVQPKIILAVGGVAAHNLLKVETPVSRLRGQVHHYDGVPLVVTYHPAYLLRKPSEKAKSWADLKFAAAVVKGEKS